LSLDLKGRYILNIQEKVGHGTIGFKTNHDEKKDSMTIGMRPMPSIKKEDGI
jgi:hypothetical protein